VNGALGIHLASARDILVLGYCAALPLFLLAPATNDVGRR
jgi:hypothetical protein